MQSVQSLDQFFELKKPKAFSNRVVLVCGLMAAIEAMDVYVLGVIISPMAREFDVTLAYFSMVFMFQAIGQIAGTYLLAPLADTYGRRPVIMWCTVAFGVLTLTSAMSESLPVFIAQRAIAFVFIGGAIPNIFAIASEYASGQARHRNSLIIGSFHGVGAGMAALAGGMLLPFGWQVPLVACGVLTLLSAVLGYIYVPESVRFLAASEDRATALKKVVARIDPSVESYRFEVDSPARDRQKLRVAELFTPELRKQTLLLWTVGAVTLSLLSSIAQWLPTYIHTYGQVDLTQAAYMTSINGPAGVIWPLVLIWLLRRTGVSLGMALNYTLAATAFACFALIPFYANVGWLLAIGLGAFLGGATSGFYALCNAVYPTRLRATGTSFAVGTGRIFSLFVPVLGGLAVTTQVGAPIIAFAIAVPLLLAALAAFAIGKVGSETSSPGTVDAGHG